MKRKTVKARGAVVGAKLPGLSRAEGIAPRSFFFLPFAFLLLTCRSAEAQLVKSVETVGITVSDMDRSLEFFSKILAFEKVSDVEVWGTEYERLQGVFGLRMRVVRLRLGDEIVELTEYLAPKGRPIPVDSRSNDHWFQHIAIVVSDMDKAYQHLRAHKAQHASTGPQQIPDWNKAAAGIRAFYFRDPDGHNLELIYFPPAKGNPRWQRKDRLFLGIDHTAIVVSDTERSLKFYGGVLGMKVAGESENHGIEQERLNNVFGARLRITGLRAPAGPGVELLDYLTPRDGRPAPVDSRANDLWHWQTAMGANNLESAANKMRGKYARLVSPGIVALPDRVLGFGKGLLVRDPDGHAVQLIEK
ncbi:MAG TPA: VOC family protein [Candidatus Acidoferrales bacterium]|nr:VOC family protein [Candidatus Acidoferrales bacterium]